MPIINRDIINESQDRYLTYALSVVTNRALPDVRDGLKPVQRRILYAMLHNLKLRPEGPHKKSAAVVGEVLARFHPHGDQACYEALVRMAQDFSLRYPLIDGQGNFGSLDGDSAAAYRYTEVKLRAIALEAIGEIDEETVDFIPNFDASTEEPVVLPSRIPQLLINGVSGIAVGMSTNIPPHNLREVCKALVALSENSEATIKELTNIIKGPDFPTGCLIVNTKQELDNIYTTGRGNIVMRGEWELEDLARGKKAIVITSIPYGINKSQLVEKIAELIISRRLPQLNDVRDESTDKVRIVLELVNDANPDVAVNFLFKNSSLETNFSVNMTALMPLHTTHRVPRQIDLKEMLQAFLDFREVVVRKKLEFEKKNLLARIHILEGFVIIFDDLDAAIKIVRASSGRSDAAEKLQAKFKLSELQAYAIVDLRIYQLSKTNIGEIRLELKEKQARIAEIDKVLSDRKKLVLMVRKELDEISEKYADKRLSKIVKSTAEIELNESDYLIKEDVFAIVTKDGWLKRVRQNNELNSTRLRDGDEILNAHALNTLDQVVMFTNFGNVYALKVNDFPASSGYGSPVQKLLKFKDGENIIGSFGVTETDKKKEYILVSSRGTGLSLSLDDLSDIRRSGKRVMKLRKDDTVAAVCGSAERYLLFTKASFYLVLSADSVPSFSQAAIGVNLIDVKPGDALSVTVGIEKGKKYNLKTAGGKLLPFDGSIQPKKRAQRGERFSKAAEIIGIVES